MRAERNGYIVLFLLIYTVCQGKTNEVCANTPRCNCKWLKGKKTADCSNAGFVSIPTTLGAEIQTLIMDGNPLGELPENAFKSAGLLNLQLISLRACGIRFVNENAFRDLKILGDVDLSSNNLTHLQSRTFHGNEGLQVIKLSNNPIRSLKEFVFPSLRNLKLIDLSDCHLEHVGKKTFEHVQASLDALLLHNNNLKSIDVEIFIGLTSIKRLDLHSNPWVCDCRLKGFRDWLITKKLYSRPTACNEPSRLHNKFWDEIPSGDFACKPDIHIPSRFVFGSPGQSIMLPCHVTGSPSPQVRWVVNGRIVNNNTSPAPFSDQRWMIGETNLDNIRRWINLTITNAGYDNLGDYVCVAENNGGVMERTITVTFDDPSTLINRGFRGLGERLAAIVGVSCAAIAFVVLITVICCCCLRKAKFKTEKNFKNSNPRLREDVSVLSGGVPESQKLALLTESESLIATKIPERRSTSTRPQSYSLEERTSDPDFIQDVLETSRLTSGIFSPQDDQTFPHQWNMSSSLNAASLIHAENVYQGWAPNILPVKICSGSERAYCQNPSTRQYQCHRTATVSGSKHCRPSYVTLPRKLKSHGGQRQQSQYMDKFSRQNDFLANATDSHDPVYDGVGPRTSIDGSSSKRLNTRTLARYQHLNRSFDLGTGGVVLHRKGATLLPYLSPVVEMKNDCSYPVLPDSSDSSRRTQLPKKDVPSDELGNSSVSTLGSETTLLGENLSGYCEPFGKALIPERKKAEADDFMIRKEVRSQQSSVSPRRSRNSLSAKPEIVIDPSRSSDSREDSIDESERKSKNFPPEPLPKPKVRPLPPPKPNFIDKSTTVDHSQCT